MPDEQEKQVQIRIELDDAMGQGAYANLAFIRHTDTEFTMDFIYVQPQEPKAKVRARIISSPGHAKRFLLALEENIKNYEEKFGAIKVAGEPSKKIGFQERVKNSLFIDTEKSGVLPKGRHKRNLAFARTPMYV
jgi:hypothetical protein